MASSIYYKNQKSEKERQLRTYEERINQIANVQNALRYSFEYLTGGINRYINVGKQSVQSGFNGRDFGYSLQNSFDQTNERSTSGDNKLNSADNYMSQEIQAIRRKIDSLSTEISRLNRQYNDAKRDEDKAKCSCK